MKDDAVIKDNEAVYLLNGQTYLHLRENLAGVGYEVFDKNSLLPVEEGQIPREALGNTQRRIETARAYYLAEHQDEPVGRIQNVAVTTLEKFRSGIRRRRNLAPRSLPENDVRFIDPMYNELFRVPDGGVVQMTYPDGHQRSEVVEYLDDYHMKIGSSVQHICEFAERMARSHAIVEPEPLTQQEQKTWNLEYDYYLTVQAEDGAWEYALYQGDCCLLERGKIDAPELMIEEVRDEILYSHNLRNKGCIPLTQEEFAQKLADRNEIQSYRMKQFQQSGHDCYLVMQLQQDADPALRFAAMRYLNKQNIAPSLENYEILYRGNLPEGKRSVPQAELLERLYQKFNCARPTDYHGHSLSVSDVIMLNQRWRRFQRIMWTASASKNCRGFWIKSRSALLFCKLSRRSAMPRSATQLDAGKRGMPMNFNHEELMLMMLYNTGTRLGLIHELRLMQCYLMPDETALRELSEGVIEKLKLLTDAEFAELEFPPD